jgi:hypothetical protein
MSTYCAAPVRRLGFDERRHVRRAIDTAVRTVLHELPPDPPNEVELADAERRDRWARSSRASRRRRREREHRPARVALADYAVERAGGDAEVALLIAVALVKRHGVQGARAEASRLASTAVAA